MAVPQQRIFLSHSSKDHAFCVRLVDDLRRILGDNDAVWYDARLQGGDGWWSKIEQELNSCSIFIVVLSPDAMTSSWVNDEIDIAWRRKNHPDPASRIRIVPLLLRPCTIRPSLESLQMVSFLPPKTYETALQEVLITLGLPGHPVDNRKIPPARKNLFAAIMRKPQTSAHPPRKLATSPESIEVLRTLPGHTSHVHSIALSADGLILATGSWDYTIKLWNPQNGKLLHTLTGHTKGIYSVALSANGRTLASSSLNKTIRLWDTKTGQLVRTFKGHTEGVLSVALSTDGSLLASGSEDNTIKLWNIQTGQLVRTLTGHTSSVYSVVLSTDGQMLASGSDDETVKLWNIQTGQLVRTLTGHTSSVKSLAFSADGRTIVSGSTDQTVRRWNVLTGQLLSTFESSGYCVALSSDGSLLVSDHRDTIKLWNTQNGQLLRTLSSPTTFDIHATYSVALSLDGLLLISGGWGGIINVWGVKK